MSIATEVHARYVDDLLMVSLVSTYDGLPAIVVADDNTLPEDLDPPFVMIGGASIDNPDDCKVEDGRDVTVPIRFYDAANGSTLLIDQLAERGRQLLHRRPEGLAEGAYIARCYGPTASPTDPKFYGRELRLQLITRTNPMEES